MANYKPVGNILPSAQAASGTVIYRNITTDPWGLFLLRGTAQGAGGTAQPSAGIQVWESTNPTSTTANHTTFADVNGRYGVPCRANVKLIYKTYGK